MKKVILGLVLVASLSASEFMCDLHTKRYQNANQMAVYAIDDGEYRKAIRYIKQTLHSLEMTIVECEFDKKYKDSAEGFRVILKDKIKELEK